MYFLPLAAFAALYLAGALRFGLPAWVGLAYLAASLACFLLYAIDKSAARAHRPRTPERTLLLAGLACGWPGAVLAQQWLRHKTVKSSFQVKFWCTVLANVSVFVYAVFVFGRP